MRPRQEMCFDNLSRQHAQSRESCDLPRARSRVQWLSNAEMLRELSPWKSFGCGQSFVANSPTRLLGTRRSPPNFCVVGQTVVTAYIAETDISNVAYIEGTSAAVSSSSSGAPSPSSSTRGGPSRRRRTPPNAAHACVSSAIARRSRSRCSSGTSRSDAPAYA